MMTIKEIRDRLWASRGLGGIELGNDEFAEILESLDAHASQPQPVAQGDYERAVIEQAMVTECVSVTGRDPSGVILDIIQWHVKNATRNATQRGPVASLTARGLWNRMMERCYDPTSPKYPRYGARGIRVCDRWISFRLFHQDVGDRPEGMSINRIDNDGNYEPDNCEWADNFAQAQNKSTNVKLTFRGETLCRSEWARRMGFKRETVRNRIKFGWTVEEALTTPVGGRR